MWCFPALAAHCWSRSQCHEFGAADVRGPSGTPPNSPGFSDFSNKHGGKSNKNGGKTSKFPMFSNVFWKSTSVFLDGPSHTARRQSLGIFMGSELPSLKFRRGVNHETRRVVHDWKPFTLVCQHGWLIVSRFHNVSRLFSTSPGMMKTMIPNSFSCRIS